jgi:hypothetical protein
LPQVNTTGAQPYFFTIGDVTGDGNVDWVMPDWSGNYVTVLLGNGDGTFSPRTDLPLGSSQGSINAGVIADFDGDGKLDIAVESQASDDLTVLPGKGDGTFKPFVVAGQMPNSGLGFSKVLAGDFNKGGHLDLLTNGTTLFPGKGAGTSGTPATINSHFNIPASWWGISMATGTWICWMSATAYLNRNRCSCFSAMETDRSSLRAVSGPSRLSPTR